MLIFFVGYLSQGMYTWVRLRVYIHACMYVCWCFSWVTYLKVCIHVYVYTYVHVCVYIHVFHGLLISRYAYMCTWCVWVCVLVRCVYVCACVYVCMYIYIYIYTHTYIHTDIPIFDEEVSVAVGRARTNFYNPAKNALKDAVCANLAKKQDSGSEKTKKRGHLSEEAISILWNWSVNVCIYIYIYIYIYI